MPNEEFDIMKPISADLDIGTTMFDEPQNTTSSSINDIISSPVSSDLDIGVTMFDDSTQEKTKDTFWSVTSEAERNISPDTLNDSTVVEKSVQAATFEPVKTSSTDPIITERPTEVSHTAPNVEFSSATATLPVFSPPEPQAKCADLSDGVTDLNYGFMTAEEAALFGQENDDERASAHIIDRPTPATDASAVRPPDEVAAPENALDRALEELHELQCEPVQQVPASSDQLMQMALEAEYLEEKKLTEEEWFPNSTVRVMGKVVRGKKKNIATMVMLIVFVFVFMLLPFILAYFL